ncbi:MAG TPA: hypothetical protein VKA44_08560 [Gemmatimonadota bacterium]|nr:hypothetical protein [Gemmatimonadota bacterium]
MDARPKFFSSHLSRTERRVYGGVTVVMVLACVVTVWPIYALFAGVRPLVFGLPFNLFYLAAILVGSFLILLGVFVWEGRREGPGGADAEGGAGPGAGATGPGEGAAGPGAGTA